MLEHRRILILLLSHGEKFQCLELCYGIDGQALGHVYGLYRLVK